MGAIEELDSFGCDAGVDVECLGGVKGSGTSLGRSGGDGGMVECVGGFLSGDLGWWDEKGKMYLILIS